MFVGNVVGKLQLPCSALQLWDHSPHPAPSLQSGKFKMLGLCLVQSKSFPCGECSEPASTHTLFVTGLFWSVFFAYCSSNVNIGWVNTLFSCQIPNEVMCSTYSKIKPQSKTSNVFQLFYKNNNNNNYFIKTTTMSLFLY